MIRIFLFSSLLTVGLSEMLVQRVQAQVDWKSIDNIKAQPGTLTWETDISNSVNPDKSPAKWRIVPEAEDQNQSPSGVVWEVLKTKDEMLLRSVEKESNLKFIPPGNFEEA